MSAAIDTTPHAAYATIEAVNWSLLKHMSRSPLHFLHARDNERPDSDTFRKGRLTHTLVLEPDRFDFDYVIWDGKRRAGKVWDAFEAESAGRTVIPAKMLGAARAMADAVLARWRPPAQRECVVTWTDPETGLRCKGRIDAIEPGVITEIKTARDVGAPAMSRQLHSLGYYAQLAHYRMGVRALTGVTSRCRIVAVESEAPHDVAIFDVDEEALILGEEEVTALLRRVAECRAKNEWPGRYSEPQALSLPHWIQNEDEDDVASIGLDLSDEEETE